MAISRGQSDGRPTIIINGIKFDDLPDAKPSRAYLARAKAKLKMNGKIKSAEFPLLRYGELLSVEVKYNQHTKFSILKVGKLSVTEK